MCVRLPEAGPASRTAPASCPWERHRWPAAAKLEGRDGREEKRRDEKEEDELSRSRRQPLNRQPLNRQPLRRVEESLHSVGHKDHRQTEDTPYGSDEEERRGKNRCNMEKDKVIKNSPPGVWDCAVLSSGCRTCVLRASIGFSQRRPSLFKPILYPPPRSFRNFFFHKCSPDEYNPSAL